MKMFLISLTLKYWCFLLICISSSGAPRAAYYSSLKLFLYSVHNFTWHHSNECTIQQGNLPNLSSGKKLEQGTYVTTFSYINEALSSHTMERHTSAKSLSKHPGKAFCTIPMGSCIRSTWFNCLCQFSRCLDAILFLSLSLEPWCRDWDFFLIITVIILIGRDGCLAHNAATPSVCYFCCWWCGPPAMWQGTWESF